MLYVYGEQNHMCISAYMLKDKQKVKLENPSFLLCVIAKASEYLGYFVMFWNVG